MFQIRRETDYAIQLVKFLAKKSNFTSLKEASEKTGISFLFLQKIARKLRIARILKAEKGVEGGYVINMQPGKISLRIIIEAMEGKIAILPCYNQQKQICCANKNIKCALKNKLRKTNSQIYKIIDNIKLKDL